PYDLQRHRHRRPARDDLDGPGARRDDQARSGRARGRADEGAQPGSGPVAGRSAPGGRGRRPLSGWRSHMDGSDRIARLPGLPSFGHLPDSALGALARVVVWRTYRPGTVIFDHGAPGAEMFLLVAGTVRIERDVEAGGTKRLAALAPGEVFGEMAL